MERVPCAPPAISQSTKHDVILKTCKELLNATEKFAMLKVCYAN